MNNLGLMLTWDMEGANKVWAVLSCWYRPVCFIWAALPFTGLEAGCRLEDESGNWYTQRQERVRGNRMLFSLPFLSSHFLSSSFLSFLFSFISRLPALYSPLLIRMTRKMKSVNHWSPPLAWHNKMTHLSPAPVLPTSRTLLWVARSNHYSW